MSKASKEKQIKEINVKELNANWRTALIISIFATFVLTWIGCYFVTHMQISEANQQAVQVVNSVSKH